MKRRIDQLKNFGFTGETEVVALGINSKMDEIRAAYGLLNLRRVDAAIASVAGIRCLHDIPGVQHNYSYFPIFVDATTYGHTRDELYFHLKEHGILSRRYFYPLIPDFEAYRASLSARAAHIPTARAHADSVICLPLYDTLTEQDAEKVVKQLNFFSNNQFN